MDTSDSVGWFVVDMRDIAGQRQQERWVKLQGASPAEVLISSSLSIVREQDAAARDSAAREQPADHDRSPARNAAVNHPAKPRTVAASVSEEAVPVPVAADSASPALSPPAAEALQTVTAEKAGRTDVRETRESVAVLATPAAEAVSDLDALPVGPGADGNDASLFSLSISVKGAAGLSGLAPSMEGNAADGAGFWFSYCIFGVVVQTDRFERLAPTPPGDGPILEPMLDSFRLRATLHGLCGFLGDAPPLQVRCLLSVVFCLGW